MRPVSLESPTRRLGAPSSWDHAEDGICHTLEILDHDGWMISAWEPTPQERERLAAGARIFLQVQGTRHPVVAMQVEEQIQNE
jgi:hypothetical protein